MAERRWRCTVSKTLHNLTHSAWLRERSAAWVLRLVHLIRNSTRRWMLCSWMRREEHGIVETDFVRRVEMSNDWRPGSLGRSVVVVVVVVVVAVQ